MAKFCPIVNSKVPYLTCLECKNRLCEDNNIVRFKIDMHTHTFEGSLDATVTIEDTINRLIKLDYDGVLITDHCSKDGCMTVIDKKYDDFKVFFGIEYTTAEGDILVILPDKKLDIPYSPDMTINRLRKIVTANGGIMGLAHPFRDRTSVFFYERNEAEIMKDIDFVEVHNGKIGSPIIETKARILADLYNKPCVNGSDSHKLSGVGRCHTFFDMKITDESDLIFAVKNNRILPSLLQGRDEKR